MSFKNLNIHGTKRYILTEVKSVFPLVQTTVNPLLSPAGGLFFSNTFEGGGGLIERGGLFNLAKYITCSKNTVVSDTVDLRVVQFKPLSKVFDSLVVA